MKSTLADNRQILNVKAIASGVALEALQEGQLGIFPAGGGNSISSSATFNTLPEEFFFISKLGGKIYRSFDTFKKSQIIRKTKSPYKAGVVNILKATLDSCACINFATLVIDVNEAGLEARDGLTWQHRDTYTVTKPEYDCACANGAEGDTVKENNIFTKLLVEKIVQTNSDYYTAEMQKEDGTVVELEDFETFFKENFEEGDDGSGGSTPAPREALSLVITGKDFGRKVYNDLEVNYIYPRGVKLRAGLVFDNKVDSPFTFVNAESFALFNEEQALVYENGAGADLRALEWDLMGYFTNVIDRTLPCGALVPDVVFQFENGKNYNSVSFEVLTDKTETNNGDKRLFGVILATETSSVYNQLVTIFGA